ncbi:hypothetical protein B0A81_17705 [Flavobacterium plurextorum]|uniref:Uncharacterized protein n=1 Tax=Flavobacterium plurextorum TaxID=1114867 RepID=A0ABX4CQI1_9FLAO|nr:hypothetical protein B0A81_17705 [Flavobacterium plurextorum]
MFDGVSVEGVKDESSLEHEEINTVDKAAKKNKIFFISIWLKLLLQIYCNTKSKPYGIPHYKIQIQLKKNLLKH